VHLIFTEKKFHRFITQFFAVLRSVQVEIGITNNAKKSGVRKVQFIDLITISLLCILTVCGLVGAFFENLVTPSEMRENFKFWILNAISLHYSVYLQIHHYILSVYYYTSAKELLNLLR